MRQVICALVLAVAAWPLAAGAFIRTITAPAARQMFAAAGWEF